MNLRKYILKLSALFLLSAGISVSSMAEPFSLSPVKDGIILGSTFTLCATDLILDKAVNFDNAEFKGSPYDKNDVNPFDRIFMQPYSDGIDLAGDIFVAASVLTPAVLIASGKSEWLTAGVMYAETILMAHGIKEFGKLFVHRPRPYMYYDDYPESEVSGGDWNDSFPSGHTTFAFAGATFTSYTFCKYFPDSKWKIPVVAASYSLAVATAVMRVAGGNHFVTDVLAGAAIGGLSGFLVPFLHTKINSSEAPVTVSPTGVYFKLNL